MTLQLNQFWSLNKNRLPVSSGSQGHSLTRSDTPRERSFRVVAPKFHLWCATWFSVQYSALCATLKTTENEHTNCTHPAFHFLAYVWRGINIYSNIFHIKEIDMNALQINTVWLYSTEWLFFAKMINTKHSLLKIKKGFLFLITVSCHSRWAQTVAMLEGFNQLLPNCWLSFSSTLQTTVIDQSGGAAPTGVSGQAELDGTFILSSMKYRWTGSHIHLSHTPSRAKGLWMNRYVWDHSRISFIPLEKTVSHYRY